MRRITCGRCREYKAVDQFTMKADKRICDYCATGKFEDDKLKKAEMDRKFDCTTRQTPIFKLYSKTPQAKRARERRRETADLLEDIALKNELKDY